MTVNIWNKKDTLFERDEAGKLIPKRVLVEGLSEEQYIIITPLLRGEIKRIRDGLDKDGNSTKDQDAEIIKMHCLEPKYSDEELPFVKKYVVDAIVTTIIHYSGLIPDKTSMRTAIDQMENDIKKNLKAPSITGTNTDSHTSFTSKDTHS